MWKSPEDYTISPLKAFSPKMRFFLALLPGLIILALIPFAPSTLSNTPAIFLYPPVLLAAWLGGVLAGSFNLFVCILVSLFYFRAHLLVDPMSDFPSFVRLGVFFSTNIFFLFLLDRLEKALKKSRNALSVRDNFISAASHELKTPLTSMMLQIDVAKLRFKDHEDVELNKFLDKIKKQSNRLDQLISGMIDVTLIDSSQFLIIPKQCDLSEITASVVDYFREKDAAINFVIHSAARGFWDPERLEQVVYCLIQNAIKCGNNKEIKVEVSIENGMAVLIVCDEGPGLNHKQIKSLFDRFPAATSTYHESGLGLGLYLSQGIAQKHGGNISVESVPGKKTVFKFSIPQSQPG